MKVLEEALALAENGMFVFPCNVETKSPMTKEGFYDAVSDPLAVRRLFDWAGENCLIGVRTGKDSDLLCLDFDLYKGPAARTFLDKLIAEELLPNTRVHATRNGGLHLLYSGDGVDYPTLAPSEAVEVKGEGGYIIWWPAHGQKVIQEGMAEAPHKLLEYLRNYKRAMGSDTLDALKQKVLSGTDFHDPLTRIAARLSGASQSQETVFRTLLSILSASVAANPQHPRHSRWKALMENSGDEVSRIIGTSHRKYNAQAASTAFAEGTDDVYDRLTKTAATFFSPLQRGNDVQDPAPEIKQIEDFIGFPFESEGYFAHDNHDLLSQRFIMYPVFCEGESVLIAAEPKAGKTAVTLTVGLHVASGLNLGPSLRVSEPRGVLYFGLEGRRAIRLRIAAWRRHMADSGATVPEFIPLFVVEKSKNLLGADERQELANAVKAAELWLQKEHGVDLGMIVVDTFTKAMPGGDQNSVEDTSSTFDVVARIRENNVEANIVFIHHKARAGNVRGSTNIEADPDVLTSVTKEANVVSFRVDRARSIEEGEIYRFALNSYDLGVSSQGYTISAPVCTPVDADENRKDVTAAQTASRTMGAIVSLGVGKHDLKVVYDILLASGLAPVSMNRRRANGKMNVDNAAVQDFFAELIPDTGYVFAAYSVQRVVEGGKTVAIFIR